MGTVPGPDEPRGWAPLEPEPELPPAPTGAPPPLPAAARSGAWAPPQGPPGWATPPPPPPSDGGPGGYGPPPGPGGYAAYGAVPPAPLPKAGDARTGPLPLHPMGVGDILDGAFKLLKANARTILLVVAAILVPIQLISAFVVRDQFSTGFISLLNDPTLMEGQETGLGSGSTVLQILTTLLSLLTGPIIAGVVSRVVASSYVGEELGAGAALKLTLRRAVSLVVASVLVALASIAGLILCIVPGVLLFALYTAVTPALMIEEIGPIQAMRRSWRLLKPRWWRVLGIVVLAHLIAGFLGNILGGIPSVAAVAVGGSFAWLFVGLGSVLSSLVSAPIIAIVSTLLYFDGRIRNEGFDLQVMARDLGGESAPTRVGG